MQSAFHACLAVGNILRLDDTHCMAEVSKCGHLSVAAVLHLTDIQIVYAGMCQRPHVYCVAASGGVC